MEGKRPSTRNRQETEETQPLFIVAKQQSHEGIDDNEYRGDTVEELSHVW